MDLVMYDEYIICNRVPYKSYIHHTKLDPFLDDDNSYTLKQITKKKFTSEWLLQKGNAIKQIPNPTHLGYR